MRPADAVGKVQPPWGHVFWVAAKEALTLHQVSTDPVRDLVQHDSRPSKPVAVRISGSAGDKPRGIQGDKRTGD